MSAPAGRSAPVTVPPAPLQAPDFVFPATDDLAASLADVFGGTPPEVAARELCPQTSSFPSEIVSCHHDGTEVRLLLKYAHGEQERDHGHRGGVVREAEAYARVLEPLAMGGVRSFGLHASSNGGHRWLALEYLDAADRIERSGDSRALVRAAAWIGRFHAATEPIAAAGGVFPPRYDRDYYLGWSQRTLAFGRDWIPPIPWLEEVCGRFDDALEILLHCPHSVIHGEYYPKNILMLGGVPYPIDWETAAVGLGEIDLATLTEGWPPATVSACEEAYRGARWPGGAPPDFARRLDAARLYIAYRWLGDRWDWTIYSVSSPSRWDELKTATQRLGLLA